MGIRLNVDPQLLGKEKGNPVTLEVTGDTVAECLDQFISKEPVIKKAAFDETGELKITTQVYINDVPVLIRPLERRVKDRDEIGLIYMAPASC